MKCKIKEEEYLTIPLLIEQGFDRHQIAEKFGVTVKSLQVMCCRRGISLRRKDLAPFVPKRDDDGNRTIGSIVTQWLRPECMRALRSAAAERNTTPEALAGKLLRVICRDNLFNAVIDTGPHTYADAKEIAA